MQGLSRLPSLGLVLCLTTCMTRRETVSSTSGHLPSVYVQESATRTGMGIACVRLGGHRPHFKIRFAAKGPATRNRPTSQTRCRKVFTVLGPRRHQPCSDGEAMTAGSSSGILEARDRDSLEAMRSRSALHDRLPPRNGQIIRAVRIARTSGRCYAHPSDGQSEKADPARLSWVAAPCSSSGVTCWTGRTS
jgi:hypothetical protein